MKETRTPEQLKGQGGTCETMLVDYKNGPKGVLINVGDFDEDLHVKAKAKKEDDERDTSPDFTRYNKKELKAHLDSKKVAYDKDATNDELVALCVANP